MSDDEVGCEWVVLDQRPLNGCVCVRACVHVSGSVLPVHRDQLRAPRSVTSMGKLYPFLMVFQNGGYLGFVGHMIYE